MGKGHKHCEQFHYKIKKKKKHLWTIIFIFIFYIISCMLTFNVCWLQMRISCFEIEVSWIIYHTMSLRSNMLVLSHCLVRTCNLYVYVLKRLLIFNSWVINKLDYKQVQLSSVFGLSTCCLLPSTSSFKGKSSCYFLAINPVVQPKIPTYLLCFLPFCSGWSINFF